MRQIYDQPSEIVRCEIPDLEVVRDIGSALAKGDDELLWKAARRAQSQSAFYEQLRSQVGYTTYPGVAPRLHKNRMEFHCSLLMIPILLPAQESGLLGDTRTCDTVMPHIRSWLMEWFGNKVEVTMYNCLFGYQDVCMWAPSTMRERLLQLAMHTKHAATNNNPCDFNLPAEAPILCFLVAAVHRPLAWPELPPLVPEDDIKLQARISGALHLCSQSMTGSQIKVLTPNFASEGIGEGIDVWLEAIAQLLGIKRWDVQQADLDAVVLQLEVGDDAREVAIIPLRAHQLGLDGIEQQLTKVARLGSGFLTRPQ